MKKSFLFHNIIIEVKFFLSLWKMLVFFFVPGIKIVNQTRRHFMVLLVVVGLAFAVQISCSPKCGVRFLCYLVFSKKV